MVELLNCARKARQKFLRATVGAKNEAAAALLAAFGFREKETHACLRLPRPRALPESSPPAGIELRRVGPDQADAYFAFTRSLLPREERQTRALLKADHYVAICAWREGSPVACVEVDLRYDDVATVEQLEAPPSLLAKGFGNTLLLEAARHAFGDERIQALDLVMKGADPARREALAKSGFTVRHELVSHDLRL